ncbi:DUF3224 domain-containing protein [Brevundimonas sp. FT23028]|uniref:DUF3224 domain-containing protein n=1 Tax=Brevundimonas sp. FT23028 TaxID=3393748 RepID=UPI003B586F20
MLAPVLAAIALSLAPQEASVSHQASGTFNVSITPVAPAEGAAPDTPGRMILSKTFHGGLTGTGEGEMLATMGPEQSGAYVAMERVRGSLDGRDGTFMLVHRGIMDRGAQELLITVVPGSGTGELEGLTGVFHLTIAGGEHRYVLDYNLPTE